METITAFIEAHVNYAHWVTFGLLILAGLNVPISEDLLILVSGVLASTVVPENLWKLFFAVFLGAYLSDWMVYWMGRIWGPSLWRIRWFSRLFKPKRLEQITHYYNRYGVLTLLIGRFIPFGVRNALFVTAGIARMPFRKFLLGDGIACLISNSTLFALAYYCGKNSTSIMSYIHVIVFSIFLFSLIGYICYKKFRTAC